MKKHKYILALDQGTTSSRAIVFDDTGAVVSSAQAEFAQVYPAEGWVEHDPLEIYSSQMGVVSEALARGGLVRGDVTAIGITNQRETTIVWEKATGKPIYNAIVWQCRRTAERCDALTAKGYDKMIYRKTGLTLDAYFSATKLEWILDSVDGARERAERGELLFGTVDTYLTWKFSAGEIFATDYTNASRTMLFNIHTLEWDEELLKLFGIPRSMLPEVKPSGSNFGVTHKSVLGAPVPICSAVGDQQAALFGQLCTQAGDLKNTYGTGCFLLMNTGEKAVKSNNGLVTTLGATLYGKPPYVLEGSVFVGGAVVQWLRDGLKIIASADESEALARKVDGNGGVYVVPAFTGLGAPWWDGAARGTITGITRGTSRGHIVRAGLESIAYQVADLVQAMEKDAGIKITRLAVDGGASKNEFLLQFQSDILNCPLVRPEVVETTALGAAYLAGLTVGLWENEDEIKSTVREGREFTPDMNEEERHSLLSGWQRAIRQTRVR